MSTIDFTHPVYKLNAENGNMWIEKSTLAQVVRDSAAETTSPRGVEPKLHIEERDGEWQLRMWGPSGRGNSLVEVCESKENAEQRWLEIIYEDDFTNSEERFCWFDSEEEAIKDYVAYWSDEANDDDEPITIESVKAELAKGDAEHAEKIERIKQSDIETYRNGIEIYEKTGTISKKLRNICSTILYSVIRSNPWERLTEVHHDEEFKNEVRNFYTTVVCKK